MRSTVPLVLASAASILVLAGCSATTADDSAVRADASPLQPYLDAIYGSGGDAEARRLEEESAVEEKVAACMKEQGFEYTPNSSADAAAATSDEDWEPDDRSWVEQWGYGIVDWPGREQAREEGEAALAADANYTYVMSLSEAEQRAYEIALTGAVANEVQEAAQSDEPLPPNDGGCNVKAHNEVMADAPAADLGAFEDLMGRMESLWSKIESDTRFVDLDEQWSACMGDGGEPGFSRPSDAQQSISAALGQLTPPASDTDSAQSDSTEVTPQSDLAAATLQEREIELALVDLSCREETDYYTRRDDIMRQIEQEFVDANKEELDAMKRAAEQAG